MELGAMVRLAHPANRLPNTSSAQPPLRFKLFQAGSAVSLRQRQQILPSKGRWTILAAGAVDSTMQPIVAPSRDVLELWRTAEAVCFDVDSTVCVDEGIDELASYCGAGEAVASWTAKAMGGTVTFQQALAARLGLFRPSLSVVNQYLTSHPPKLTPGIRELVEKVHSRGTQVYLVSGGFRQMIEPAAVLLGIPKENIFANRLVFDDAGGFDGFDEDEPTSRSGGKATAIALIKKQHGYKRMVMIGDGATDLEARMPGGADIFICFAGVQMRPNVAAGADWCVTDFNTLAQGLD
ncbi:phosphoserine phosphatase, chloroplastic [Selaginella moellendorffii]|nr:phosphoserine phosphatase, chloroplastic [Selaginella moellendorffii]|eukprot:XP_002972198.2 phosphoserine phosphatase, chloroplastic [Selaginella moellendorffii]